MNSAVNDDPGVSRTGRPGDRPGDETARRDDTVRHEPVRDGTGRTESGRNETTNEMTQDTVLRETAPDRRDVVQRQREAYGGIKVGSCFFGWLTATGTALLLTALIAAAGAGLSLSGTVDTAQATRDPRALGLAGGIALLVVMFIAYFCGGYVAGRMARFNGLRQGLGVWLWAILIAVIVAVLGAVAGQQFDLLARLNGFPRIPMNEGDLTTGGILAAAGVAVVSLLGAMLGGLTGMRFHRRVDRVGYDPA